MKFSVGRDNYRYSRVGIIPGIMWLGGAVHTANLPGFGFWDGLIWLYYVGRYVATHFGAGA
jgi:hypothetical protein